MTGSDIAFWTLLFVAISSLAAFLTVLLGFLESRGVHRTHRAQAYLGLNGRYSSPEMHRAFHALRAWREDAGEEFADLWNARYREREAEALELDVSRRLVSCFYYDTLRLFELGVLDRNLARELLHGHGARVYAQICLPMGEPIYQEGQDLLARLRRLQPDFGTGPV